MSVNKTNEAVETANVYGAVTPTSEILPNNTSKPLVKGDHLMLFDSNKQSLAYATSHSFSMSLDTEEISTKDHSAFGNVEGGKINWEISADHLFTNQDFGTLFGYMIAKEPIMVYWGNRKTPTSSTSNLNAWEADATASSFVYGGKALITSLEVSADTGAKATYSVTLTGVGEIKRITA